MKSPALLLVLSTLCACSADGQPDQSPRAGRVSQQSGEPLPEGVLLHLDLEDVSLGSLPEGWTLTETSASGTPATWAVRESPGGGQALHVATANRGGTYNLLLSPAVMPADLELSLRVRADTGEEDQGGGLVWRARGSDDYYIARWNPLEANLRVYKVEGGERTLFQNADTAASATGWHTLGVAMVGDHISVSLDGEPLLDTYDETFAAAGRVGLWTKADACTWFDELVVREPRWPEER